MLNNIRKCGLFFTSRLSTSCRSNANLNGKVAIVTASTEGIGFAIAQKLGKDGAKVVISSRKQENVEKATESLKNEGIDVSGYTCHVGNSAQRKGLLETVKEKHGGVDILVSNAAVNPFYGTLLDTPEDSFDKIFDINVKSAFMLVKETVPLMKERKNPSIVLVSSIAAFTPFNMLGVYSVSKTALVGLTKAFSTELAPHNIRINCLAPGIIQTKFSGALWKNERLKNVVLKQIPMGRLGVPEDCGGIVSHICSDEATYITGETFVVSGGMQSRL